jgi:hypothetical protein
MRYLTLGSVISLIFLFNSCTDTWPSKSKGIFHFVNETNYAITYTKTYSTFNVPAKSTTTYSMEIPAESTISDYVSPLADLNEKLNITFGNVKCLIDVKIDDIHSIKNIKNFTAEKIGNDLYKFTYTFTEADYNRAVTCP